MTQRFSVSFYFWCFLFFFPKKFDASTLGIGKKNVKMWGNIAKETRLYCNVENLVKRIEELEIQRIR